MENKETFLKKLSWVKVILGNGFDLFCGLKTSYRDYFDSRLEQFKVITKAIDNCFMALRHDPEIRDDLEYAFRPGFDIKKANAWDILFAMLFDEKTDYSWCDIEASMLELIAGSDIESKDKNKPHLKDVWMFLQGDRYNQHGIGSFVFASFCAQKMAPLPKNEEEFYETLLLELRSFERSFATFITNQHIHSNTVDFSFNRDYIEKAHIVLKNFCNPESIVSIDCFNYGFTPESQFFEKCWFINGDCFNPIFGVDSVFEPDDPRYIFTKTNRRIERDMQIETAIPSPAFNNAIIFGHSLGPQDYSYLFPVLDKLEMTDFSSSKKLVFVYSIYDPSKETEIKKDLRKKLYALFGAYAEHKHIAGKASRLLDSLSTQGRVTTVQISPLEANPNFLQSLNASSMLSWEDNMKERWGAYINYGKNLNFPRETRPLFSTKL